MVIVAFLQNQWFKNPDRIAEIYARHETPEGRAKLNARFLFYRSRTGKRLVDAFGQEICESIIWEEASREVGSVSSHCPPADPAHIQAVIEHFKPNLVLAFGKVAQGGVIKSLYVGCELPRRFEYIEGPHPTARHSTAAVELKAMASKVRELIYHLSECC